MIVQCWFNSSSGAKSVNCYLETKDCIPSKLVNFAKSQGCLFVTVPLKYGGRQFCNPDLL